MTLVIEDIVNLREGKAPVSMDLAHAMTVGNEAWLDRFVTYYLDRYVPAGGSKVKVIVGDEGTGKSHVLRFLQYEASERHYVVLYLSARQTLKRLNDLTSLYRLIVESIDFESLVSGLASTLADSLGYRMPTYDGQNKLVPFIMAEGMDRSDASREIRLAINRLLNSADLTPSAKTFASTLLKHRLIEDDDVQLALAKRWLNGERLSMQERRAAGLFEMLNRTTARRYIDSLLKLIVLSGYKGLLLLIDDLDVLSERSAETGRFIYTPSAIKDTCELFRQIIDDAEVLRHMLVVLAGSKAVLEDEKRGFRSYEALWMRLQTGLVPSSVFNSLCDVLDLDQYLASLPPSYFEELSTRVNEVFNQYGIQRRARSEVESIYPVTTPSLRHIVIANTYVVDASQEMNDPTVWRPL